MLRFDWKNVNILEFESVSIKIIDNIGKIKPTPIVSRKPTNKSIQNKMIKIFFLFLSKIRLILPNIIEHIRYINKYSLYY